MQGAEILIPLSAIFLIFGIPIVAIWSSHKQKMKQLELAMRSQGQSDDEAIRSMRNELSLLRERVNEQALVVESMKDLVRAAAETARTNDGEAVQQRLNS